jgi:transposase
MVIKRHKRGDRVYLSEYKSYREDGKVKTKFIKYIGVEGEPVRKNLAKGKTLERIKLSESHRAGDVKLLWELAKDLDFIPIIDRICCGESDIEGPSPGKYLTAWAINRCIMPESATQLENWIPSTVIPQLSDINPADFTKDTFLEALDFVCVDNTPSGELVDYTSEIDEALFDVWRKKYPLKLDEKEMLAYDLTTVLFFGVSCPITELGYNPDKIKRQQVNLALLVSKREKYPMTHFVYEGSRNGSATVKNMLFRLNRSSIEPGTIIWDRGMVSKEHVRAVVDSGWDLIAGIPKKGKEALEILEKTNVSAGPETMIMSGKISKLYAVKTTGSIFGGQHSLVVYFNQARAIQERDQRNVALWVIAKDLDKLAEKGKGWTEKKLHSEIKKIIGSYDDYIGVRVKRKGSGPRIAWKYKKRELARIERFDGKWLLLSTRKDLSAEEVVRTYLEKDYIEKVFRIIKTHEEVVPVRHRLEKRVRAYLFVCVLAYRLLAYLQWRIHNSKGKKKDDDSAIQLLKKLGRVQRVEVTLGNEVKVWYLNVTKDIDEWMRKIKMKKLFEPSTRVEL